MLRPEGAGATGDLAWQDWGRFGRRIGERCRQADAFVAISREIAARAGARRATIPARIHALPNGVPVPESPWQRRPDWRAAPRAVFVGRLAPEKGLDALIDAWPRVRSVHPEARLILIGEGPERPALEAQARALGLGLGPDQAVELPGAVADVDAALRSADLFVLPSTEEGMSIALLEAMALGIPLVASSIPGNRRLVSDFKHGRLAPPEDPAALARVDRRTMGRLRPRLPHEPRGSEPGPARVLDRRRGRSTWLFETLIERRRAGGRTAARV